jgi:hypothetical protein
MQAGSSTSILFATSLHRAKHSIQPEEQNKNATAGGAQLGELQVAERVRKALQLATVNQPETPQSQHKVRAHYLHMGERRRTIGPAR